MELKNEADSQLIKHIEYNWVLRSVWKVWSEETAQRYWGGLFQSLRSETLKAPAIKHCKSELGYCKNSILEYAQGHKGELIQRGTKVKRHFEN